MADISDSRYEVKYVGDPRSDGAILKTLTAAGPLSLAKEHFLVRLLPDVAEDEVAGATATGRMAMALTLVHTLIFQACMVSADVGRGGVHFAVKASRLAMFFRDLEQVGFDMSPIRGAAEAAVPIAIARFAETMQKLTTHQRTINADDVIYDGDIDNPGTDSWYDWVTPSMLTRGDGGMQVVAQWCNLTPGCFSKAETGGRKSDEFTSIIQQMEGSIGRDISALPQSAQAAAVAEWFKRSKPPAAMHIWTDTAIEGVALELERCKCSPRNAAIARS